MLLTINPNVWDRVNCELHTGNKNNRIEDFPFGRCGSLAVMTILMA